jgi:hypothetical protein
LDLDDLASRAAKYRTLFAEPCAHPFTLRRSGRLARIVARSANFTDLCALRRINGIFARHPPHNSRE